MSAQNQQRKTRRLTLTAFLAPYRTRRSGKGLS
jgi:hypothetical protein